MFAQEWSFLRDLKKQHLLEVGFSFIRQHDRVFFYFSETAIPAPFSLLPGERWASSPDFPYVAWLLSRGLVTVVW